MRSSDRDRDSAHALLQGAYAEGRLSREEFDDRSSRVMASTTYAELQTLTADLPGRLPFLPQPLPHPMQMQYYPPAAPRRTSSMAVGSLVCGIGQLIFWFPAGIAAIVLGHMARRQIRQTGEAGDGMAVAGLVLGWIGIGLTLLFALFVILAFAATSHG
jgi:Domain of unknown function (DUF4190)/Domain of unknown function (DUF1707)